jgi:hypothetical protein
MFCSFLKKSYICEFETLKIYEETENTHHQQGHGMALWTAV